MVLNLLEGKKTHKDLTSFTVLNINIGKHVCTIYTFRVATINHVCIGSQTTQFS